MRSDICSIPVEEVFEPKRGLSRMPHEKYALKTAWPNT